VAWPFPPLEGFGSCAATAVIKREFSTATDAFIEKSFLLKCELLTDTIRRSKVQGGV
jgi:hypothetical protein